MNKYKVIYRFGGYDDRWERVNIVDEVDCLELFDKIKAMHFYNYDSEKMITSEERVRCKKSCVHMDAVYIPYELAVELTHHEDIKDMIRYIPNKLVIGDLSLPEILYGTQIIVVEAFNDQ